MEKNNKFTIIAGPCAIETKDQFFDTIRHIHNFTDVIRCGVWKARTSPNNFSGQGDKALTWIQQASKKYNTPVAIEVGTKHHVEIALKHNINIFWIGARTTTNPFAIQEIAETVKGLNTEIWIKNPIFPDLELWFGAIERFKRNETQKIKVIHRGFFSEKKSNYRNPPRWDLLKKFQDKYPNIPVICDPSHIAGNRKLVPNTTEKAIKMGIRNLMIEVHNQPQKALSDSKQQLTPLEFIKLIEQLN